MKDIISIDLEVQHIIIFGNRKKDTFGNTIRAIKKKWPDVSERHLHVFEMLDSNTQEELPDWNQIGRDVFSPPPFYHNVPIREHTELPKLLAKVLNDLIARSNITANNLFIDLTNGTKTWSELVYLTCTLMQLHNLFRVKVTSKYFNTPYSQVPLEEIDIIEEPTLERYQLKELSRSVFSEYIFFLEEGYKFTEWLDHKSKLKISASSLKKDLRALFVHFIQGNHTDCIVHSGKVLELILGQIIEFLENFFPSGVWGKITKNTKGRELGKKAEVLSQASREFESCLSKSTYSNNNLVSQEDAKRMIPILPIGYYCKALSRIRNFSAHSGDRNHLLQSEIDARQMIHGILYILGKLQECEVFE
ncbi:MAG: hypothetical protein AAGG51_22335 [Cyanobacteria bacterium P01_G01_bin.54]